MKNLRLKSIVKNLAVASLSIVLFFMLLGVSFAKQPGPSFTFPGGKRGQEAINALRERLPEVASRYGKNAEKLKKNLLHDKDLWLDPAENLLYLCSFDLSEADALPENTESAIPTVPLPLDQTFLLHSLPGASKVIYLDFDGHVTSGTVWNTSFNGGADIVSLPYDFNGNTGSFSDAELSRIQNIWARVAEDFAIYDIDVTTEDPGPEALRNRNLADEHYGVRVVISPTSSWYGNAGGVAYVGSFDWNSDTPAFVFSNKLGNGNEKYVTEATSHESGHTLGLSHDGKTGGTSYYSGHGSWAPIMGNSYYKPITQWSRGEYAGANNTQDDLTVMLTNGASYRPDDHGDWLDSPTVLSGENLIASGIIERTDDMDVFSFQIEAGEVIINAEPADSSPNLDILIQVLDSGGNIIAEGDPYYILPASISVNLPADTYYILVDGVGTGNPDTGYTDYASLGQYFISGTLPSADILPAAPTDLSASSASPSQINLSWSDNSSNENGFSIERSANGLDGWAEAGFSAADTATFIDTGLAANTTYHYRVTAYNVVGSSDYSNTAAAATFNLPPSAPANLNATPVSATRIDLDWTDNSDNENGFSIERSPDGVTGWAEIASAADNITIYSDIELTPGSSYFYRVTAYNENGNSDFSNTADATTDDLPPALPTSLVAAPFSASQINLDWIDNGDNEDGFKIERSTDGLNGWTEIEAPGANVTAYTDSGLNPATAYFYRVYAYNSAGNSDFSNTADTTTDQVPPAGPTSLVASPFSASQINLDWTDNGDNEDGFRVERSANGLNGWTEIGAPGANVTAYTDNSLNPATAYFYRVYAYNSAGNSAYSNVTDATTDELPPSAPSDLNATSVSASQINLAWTDNGDNEDGFRIERSADGLSGWTEIGAPGANVTAYTDSGLNPATAYFYRVYAYNSAGNSGYSNVTDATTEEIPPAGPTSLVAATFSASQINLAWTDNGDNEDGFRIERSADGLNGWTEIGAPGANVTAYTDNSLNPATAYFYRVYAYNSAGNSAYSNVTDATTDELPPSAPSDLNATSVSASQINLDWTDNGDNEDGFKIERSTDGLNGWTEIGAPGANVTAYTDSGLNPATAYFYRVYAYNSAGNSAYSNVTDAATDQAPPAAPTSLVAVPFSASQINLAWTDSGDNEDGFRIERSTDGLNGWTEIGAPDANVTAYTDSGLNPATAYFYRIYAYNSAGNSGFSNTADTTTEEIPPAAPTSLVAAPLSASQINLAWTDNGDNEDGFRIERSTDGLNGWTEIGAPGANVTAYTDSGLNPATAYFYRIYAYNNAGNSAYSNTADAATDQAPPSAPTNLVAAPLSASQINLDWTDSGDNEDGFKIERSTDGLNGWTEIGAPGANVTAYTDSGLNPATAYFYRIYAYNNAGNSAYSNVTDATTDELPPSAPSDLNATSVSASQINLAWTDSGDNEDGFRIERSTDGLNGWTEIGAPDANVTAYTDSGLNPATAYFYRIYAYNSAGNSGFSNTADTTTEEIPPAAPTSLVAAPLSASQINLAWTDNGDNEDGFRIERSTDGLNGWTEIGAPGANVTAYTDSGLNPATAYFYRIYAYNSAGNSGFSNTADTTSEEIPPAAPTSLVAAPLSASQINLAWTDNGDNEDGFRIERSTDGLNGWTEIGAPGANVTAYTDSGLNPATAYFYRIYAYNNAGNSAYSNTADAATDQVPPAGPTSLVASPFSASQINLDWTDNGDNEDGFRVERSANGLNGWTEIGAPGANVTAYTDNSLNPATAYFYRVYAYNSAGNSAYSNVTDATTDELPPSAPSDLNATSVSASQINLAWTDNGDNEDGFRIERSTDGLNGWTEIGAPGANVTAYTDSGLNPATAYFYRIYAYNNAGNSAYSNTADATTDDLPPAGPTSLVAVPFSASQINLAWTDNGDNEDGFRIERSTDGLNGWTEIGAPGANVTAYTDSGLNPATAYFYRVYAYNSAGNSAYSNTADAATDQAPPAAPTNLVAAPLSASQINLDWTDNGDNEDGFKIERSADGLNGWTEIGAPGANVTAYTDSGLNSATAYFYRVYAYNSAGNSGYSNVTDATTEEIPPAAPTNLVAVPLSASQINLAWTDNGDNEDGFRIERSTDGLNGWTEIGAPGANAAAYTDSGLNSATAYFYRVYAYNSAGNSGYSNVADATTDPNDSDSDDDGYSDLDESQNGTDPNTPDNPCAHPGYDAATDSRLPAQCISTSPAAPHGSAGNSFTMDVMYNTSDNVNTLTGLGLRIHYDSSMLTWVGFTNVLPASLTGADTVPSDDTADFDGDSATDKYLVVEWADIGATWPNSTLPQMLYTVEFDIDGALNDEDTSFIRFSAISVASGYRLDSTPAAFEVQEFNLDIDGDGDDDALSDGLMVLRYLFGFTSPALCENTLDPGAPRTCEEVELFIDGGKTSLDLDVDSNGAVDALTDGLMILRHMFGFAPPALCANAMGARATRTCEEIATYIEQNL